MSLSRQNSRDRGDRFQEENASTVRVSDPLRIVGRPRKRPVELCGYPARKQIAAKKGGTWGQQAHLITAIGENKYAVKESEDDGGTETEFDVRKLAEMFPLFTAACKKFARVLERNVDSLIACGAYALVETTQDARRLNVSKRLAFQAYYAPDASLPDYMSGAIAKEWSETNSSVTFVLVNHGGS